MAQPLLPRTRFHRSQLVRSLEGLGIPGAASGAESGPTVAERLSQWLGWTDAISLSGALQGGPPARAPAARPSLPAAALAVIDEVRRVRAELALAITSDPALAAEAAPSDGAAGAHPGHASDGPALRRCCQGHQRAMETRLAPLRARVRAALSGTSPALRQLAALDAVLEGALLVRERHLLSKVPLWLEQHLERSRRAAAPGDAGPRVQDTLLAELDLRLQPIEGMIEALIEARGASAATAPTKDTTREP